jgi:hypothetical protein
LNADYYSARAGTLVYTLPVASRVHFQAGSAKPNARGEHEGPVLKTIVNREPRAAGRITEMWNGFDESGTIRVSDQPDFVLALAVAPLPENSILTYGNREARHLSAVLPIFTTTLAIIPSGGPTLQETTRLTGYRISFLGCRS